jgi:Glycosyl transferase family 11
MKIFVTLDGGLGNQLFEYAFGRAVAIRTGGELILDPWKCRRGRTKPMQLGHFRIQARCTTKFETVVCRMVDSPRFRAVRDVLNRIKPGLLPKVVRKRKHSFDPALFEQRSSVFFDGWWQSELYFRDHREVILADLEFRRPPSPVNQEWLERIGSATAVCVHVRRGDYVTDPVINKSIGVCGLDYYRAAFDLIDRRVPSPTFFVFSDDPEWTRSNLPVPEPRHFVSHNCGISDWEDLRLMSACRHFVIANSTFSWWGAWLSRHDPKLVIAPKQWFAGAKTGPRDVIPTDWITL